MTDREPQTRSPQMLAARWGTPLMSHGFVAVPISLLRLQTRLSLEPIDLTIIVHLLRFWIDSLPFPSKAKLARDIGVHQRTVSRRIRAMRALGYLETVKGLSPRGKPVVRIDLRPFIKIATRLAIETGVDTRQTVRT